MATESRGFLNLVEEAKSEYDRVLKSGMFYVWYHEYTGVWSKDCREFTEEYSKLKEIRNKFGG